MIDFKVDKDRCVQCGECAADCVRGIIELHGGYPEISAEREAECIGCQHCFAVCSEGAVSVFGLDPENAVALEKNFPEPASLETLIAGRRSVRRYRKDPLSWEDIDALLQAVANSPTGINNRQTVFTVVDDPSVMEKIRKETMAGVKKAVTGGTLPKGLEFYSSLAEAWDKGSDVIFRGAPHMLATSTPKDGPSPEPDTLIALTHFELLAQSKGIGVLWNGLLKWAITAIVPEMRARIGIPDDHYLGYTMVFGLPDVTYYRAVRRGPARIQRVKMA